MHTPQKFESVGLPRGEKLGPGGMEEVDLGALSPGLGGRRWPLGLGGVRVELGVAGLPCGLSQSRFPHRSGGIWNRVGGRAANPFTIT